MVFQVEEFPATEPHFQTTLPERPVCQWQGTPDGSPDKRYGKTGACQRSADPDHSLVIIQIIRYCKKEPPLHGAKLPIPRDITHLRPRNPNFYGIFGPDFNNFGKIVLILPPANHNNVNRAQPGLVAGIHKHILEMPYLTNEKKASIFNNYSGTAKNTGSIEGQIALLTERINRISEHLQTNKKDFSTHRGLMQLVGKRKRLLTYLSKNNLQGYRQLIEKLGLRK